jgi:hypothetical protein
MRAQTFVYRRLTRARMGRPHRFEISHLDTSNKSCPAIPRTGVGSDIGREGRKFKISSVQKTHCFKQV